MADFSIKIKAEELGKSIEDAALGVEEALEDAIDGLANAAYSSIVSGVQEMNMSPENRQDYLRALNIDKLGPGDWMISLDSDWAQKLEEGYGPYSIKERLLNSSKTVSVGSRSGEKWVRKSKDGNRYAAVPFEQKPYARTASGDLSEDFKKLSAINRQGKEQKLTKIFKDLEGNAVRGKVASAKSDNKNLNNIVKFQYVSETGSVSSLYLTFRMVSDKSTGWNHPGFEGFQIFQDVEKFVDQELERIVNELL